MAATRSCPEHSASDRPQAMYCRTCGALLIGATLHNRYEIVERLKKGRISSVYKARDLKSSNREVAVREVLHSPKMSQHELQAAVETFQQQVALFASLTHPHLPHIYDSFTVSRRSYVVMDSIEGETLAELLAKSQGPLPVKQVFHLALQLCSVLEFLHTRYHPIIFGELNPQNVMLAKSGDIYLIDLGMARPFRQGQERYAPDPGMLRYFPPERLANETMSARADIYSLGALLYALLNKGDPAASQWQFDPLPRMNPEELPPLIERMVSRDAGARPFSAALVKSELERMAPGRRQPIIYEGHKKIIRGVAWSLDGKQVASGSSDGSIQQWEASSKKLLSTSRDQHSTVHAVAWSPDGQQVACGGEDSADQSATIHIISSAGVPVTVCRGHQFSVLALAWSPQGRLIVSGSQDKTARIWDPVQGKLLSTYSGHTDTVGALAWSPDEQQIVSGSYQQDKTVQIWKAATGETYFTYREHTDAVYTVAWSPNGSCIASAGADKAIRIWDAKSGATGQVLQAAAPVRVVAWSPDNEYIASGANDGKVQIWEASTGKSLFTYTGHRRGVYTIAWSPDGMSIASGGVDTTVQVWQWW